MTSAGSRGALDVTTIVDGVHAVGVDARTVEALVGHILDGEHVGGNWVVTVVLTSDEALRKLHAVHLGLDSVTDILTFAYTDEGDFPTSKLPSSERGGDIVISVDRAVEQADDEEWSAAMEVYFLICHGVLHLLGWDDTATDDRAAMLARQHEVLNLFMETRLDNPRGGLR